MLASLLALSCSLFERKPAVLWTDTPDMLIAAELFNASQKRHLIEVRYVEDLPSALAAPATMEAKPSLVVGGGLRASALSDRFLSLEYLFGELVLSKGSFYPALLKSGVEGKRQILVPVSFNLLLLLSGKDQPEARAAGDPAPPSPDKAVITVEEIRRRAALFSAGSKPGAERMGFSPRWPDKDFLFQWVQLGGANFAENDEGKGGKGQEGAPLPLSWDQAALDRGVLRLREYIRAANGSVEAEDAFAFRYLFAPGYKNVADGRILYAAMGSAEYLTLSPALRSKYEYRYFAEGGRLAVAEDIRYAGIPRDAPNKESAEQFFRWFFNADRQKAILEKSRALRLSESAFGIGGGFSSLRAVTEETFPAYYADLAGMAPPERMLQPPEAMPPSWERIKKDVVLPWLDETAGRNTAVSPSGEFAERLAAYLDKNPDLR
ncbi:hypothetical protein LWX53_03605 [bacterium]|nr:hypothetical protein [bacterium]